MRKLLPAIAGLRRCWCYAVVGVRERGNVSWHHQQLSEG